MLILEFVSVQISICLYMRHEVTYLDVLGIRLYSFMNPSFSDLLVLANETCRVCGLYVFLPWLLRLLLVGHGTCDDESHYWQVK